VAAVILLLITGAELFACELMAPDSCESFGFPSKDSIPSANDNCICCCTHILVAEPLVLEASGEAVAIPDAAPPITPESDPLSIYHPPKA
jgi:hypothetical protein